MAAESGHHASRAYFAQDGSLHLNGAALFVSETVDARAVLVTIGAATPTTYTQTYSTADVVVPDATYTAPTQTANTLVLTGTGIAAKTASLTLTDAVNTNAGTVATSLDQAQKDIGTAVNRLNTNLASTDTQLAALAADVILLKKVITHLIDDLQAAGLAA
jgi:hypothetical protein